MLNKQLFSLASVDVSLITEPRKFLCPLFFSNYLVRLIPHSARTTYIAQEIGGSLRHLHEECGGEPIVHYSVPLMLSFLIVVHYSCVFH